MFRKTLLILIVLILSAVPVAYAQDDMMSYTVMMGGNDELGNFLVDSEGMTLYTFANDTPGETNCFDQCLENWPALTVPEGEWPTMEPGVPGRLGVITRPDNNERQVTLDGWPLYYWVQDEAAGDATGHLVGDVWFVATPASVSLSFDEVLGHILVGETGMTLYTFGNDEANVSNCYDQCATNWPPLMAESLDDVTLQPGLAGELGLIERNDGGLQVTYDGQPLYYWVQDEAPGDTTGHLVGDVWFVIQPDVLRVGGNDDLGEFLVGPDGMTLYLFTNDEANVSNCYDQCAFNWPPLMAGENLGAMSEVGGEVGVIERDDGSLQVTYDGQPLYYWIRDVVPGDATGHEVNDVWFVVQP